MTPHAKLRTEITDWLKSIGAWYVGTNSQGYGRKGIPDILACIRGKFVAIEVKVLPDKPTPWQIRELKAVIDGGGISIVAHRLADAQNLVASGKLITPGAYEIPVPDNCVRIEVGVRGGGGSGGPPRVP